MNTVSLCGNRAQGANSLGEVLCGGINPCCTLHCAFDLQRTWVSLEPGLMFLCDCLDSLNSVLGVPTVAGSPSFPCPGRTGGASPSSPGGGHALAPAVDQPSPWRLPAVQGVRVPHILFPFLCFWSLCFYCFTVLPWGAVGCEASSSWVCVPQCTDGLSSLLP